MVDDVDLNDLMPGTPRTVEIDVCNDSDSFGHLVLATPSTGAIGSLVEISIRDHWTGGLDELLTPITVDGEILAPGERRTYELSIGLSRLADNRWANQTFEMEVALVLTTQVLGNDIEAPTDHAPDGTGDVDPGDDGDTDPGNPGDGDGDTDAGDTDVLDGGVERPVEVTTGDPSDEVTVLGSVTRMLPRTGADASRLAAVALTAVLSGVWLRLLALRRQRST